MLHEPTRVKNTAETRRRIAPDRSSATIVFSNVGGSGSAVIASTSARCSAMPGGEGGPEVLLADGVEVRELERQPAGFEERVHHPSEPRRGPRAPRAARSCRPGLRGAGWRPSHRWPRRWPQVPRRGTVGSTEVSATRRPVDPPHPQLLVDHRSDGRTAAQVHRGGQVRGDPAVQLSVVAQHLAGRGGAPPEPGPQQLGGGADGVPQPATVVLGAQVVVVDDRRGPRVGGGEGDRAAAVRGLQRAHQLQVAAGD